MVNYLPGIEHVAAWIGEHFADGVLVALAAVGVDRLFKKIGSKKTEPFVDEFKKNSLGTMVPIDPLIAYLAA